MSEDGKVCEVGSLLMLVNIHRIPDAFTAQPKGSGCLMGVILVLL